MLVQAFEPSGHRLYGDALGLQPLADTAREGQRMGAVAVQAHGLRVDGHDAAVDGACEKLYQELQAKGVDVLYDDTDQRAGAKFAAADLIGIPWQILIGPKGLAEGKLEIKRRSDGSRENLSPAEAVAKIAG